MVYLSLGSNLGDKAANLARAIDMTEARVGRVALKSGVIETEPWGFQSGNSFLNQAIGVETALPAMEILDITQQIERDMGRSEKSSNGTYSDRLIDIDLLLYDDQIISNWRLTIPHPLISRRRFVLEPLAEIAPHLMHPLLHKTIKELLMCI